MVSAGTKLYTREDGKVAKDEADGETDPAWRAGGGRESGCQGRERRVFRRTYNPPVSIPILTASMALVSLDFRAPRQAQRERTHASGRWSALERLQRGLEEEAS